MSADKAFPNTQVHPMYAYYSKTGQGNFNQNTAILGSTHCVDYYALGPLQNTAVGTNLTLTANP